MVEMGRVEYATRLAVQGLVSEARTVMAAAQPGCVVIEVNHTKPRRRP